MEFLLRPWRQTDIDDVAYFANNENIARNLRDAFPFPYAREDARAYVTGCMEQGDDGQLCRAIEAEGRAVGSVGVFVGRDVYRRSAEVGYWLAEPYWGRGIMTAAVRQICDAAFDTFDLVRVYAEPYAYNMGSRRVLEHAGFTLEGVLRHSVWKWGQLHDSCVYALVR